MEASLRYPYPFPQPQNDDDFIGTRTTAKLPYSDPTHIAQKHDPWNRLNSTCTLSSSRREVYHFDPQAPRDSLDFVLKAQYDHHNEFLRGRNETLVQPETCGLPHGRILKNRVEEIPQQENPLGHPLEIYQVKKKDVRESTHDAIDGHHTQMTNKGFIRKPDASHHSAATNGGYSRKHDGGFYCT